jgi:predicted short-subunit dehydrogenase-like oxidoreductase (DUF2520 family)
VFGPDRHQVIGAVGERVGDQIAELANLVAAHTNADEVVTLDPDVAAARRREPIKTVKGCGVDAVTARRFVGEP